MPAAVRPAFETLWNLDLALADVVASSTDVRLGAIRLAWWRERLEELDEGKAPAEPRLQAIARQLIKRGVTGKALSLLEDGWLPLLAPFPWGEEQAEGLRLRGRTLFGIGARLLGCDSEDGDAAGELWSLVDAARHCSDAQSRGILVDEARAAIGRLPRQRMPKAVRGMTVLAALAAHDALRSKPLDAGGDFARVAVATVHRLRGTFPPS